MPETSQSGHFDRISDATLGEGIASAVMQTMLRRDQGEHR